jgi:hypothetical protein
MNVHAQGLTEIYKSVVYNDAEATIPKVSGEFFKSRRFEGTSKEQRGSAFQR